MTLTSRENIESFLQVEICTDEQEASADLAIQDAQNAILDYIDQDLFLVKDDQVTFDAKPTYRIFLPQLPVVSIASVYENGELLTVDDDYKLGADGILWRIGRKWAGGIQNVVVTYTHGYADDSIPQIIKTIATRAASRAYQSGLRSSETDGVIGIASQTLGDYSVTFASGAGGGIGEGLLGASAANLLLKSEMRFLDGFKYRGA